MWVILNIYLLAALYTTITFSYNPIGIIMLCLFVCIVYLIDKYNIKIKVEHNG